MTEPRAPLQIRRLCSMLPVGMSAMNTEATVTAGVRERVVRFASGGERLAGVLSLPEEAAGTPCGSRGSADGHRPAGHSCRDAPGDARKVSPDRAVSSVPKRVPVGSTTLSPPRGVVLLHGWGTYRIGPHAILVKAAREFALRGVPALRFDFRGRGESTGPVTETGIDEMIDDAVAAVRFLRKEVARSSSGARLEDVYAVGLCSGANVALAAAALEGAFQGVAALSVLPYQSHASAMQSIRRTRGLLGKLLGKALSPRRWWRLLTGEASVLRVLKTLFGGEGGKVRTPLGEERNLKDSRRDVMGALAEYPGPILFMFGGADREGMGAKSHFDEFARANSLDAESVVVEGSNHNFYSLQWEREAIACVTGFVAGGDFGEDRPQVRSAATR